MFVIDRPANPDLPSFLAALPAGDEANEIIVPARLDPLSIRREADPRSRRLSWLLAASLPTGRRNRH